MKIKIKQLIILILFLGINLIAQTFSVDSKDERNQAQFISDAPLEKIVGLVSGLEATVMINTNDVTQKPMGKVRVAVSNIKTGIDLRDEHLRSEMWLNAAKYPYAEFQLKGIKNPTSKKLNDGERIKATLIGKFTVHGFTKDIEVPAALTYFKESEKTKAKMPGNLLVANAEFSIKLSDYDIKIPSMVTGKLNDEVKITVHFVASDVISSNNPCGTCGPNKAENKCSPCGVKKQDMKNNPCNPCAVKKVDKKNNPCNPCAQKKK
ncbi:MAG: YceI family protein [Melioribacter sp.]|uniref:YceI family protein n=1 Tax=Rosettibacter primus TaxID=3111523 RepID=UPI00247B63FB|nr:YceI family protein [Melioribacter sp.]